jgi:hypothetical protein
MGKRTIRIPRNQLAAKLDSLLGQIAQVVMLDGKTHAGRVESVADGIVLSDANAAWTSTRRHAQQLALADIHYIVLDVISPW